MGFQRRLWAESGGRAAVVGCRHALVLEPVHYKRELGDLMLDRMLRGAISPEWPDFGVRLTADNLEPHLVHLRELQQSYAAEHPAVAAMIRNLARRQSD